jgi:hypothetical protein
VQLQGTKARVGCQKNKQTGGTNSNYGVVNSRTHHHESSIHTYDAVEPHRINHFWFVLVKFTYVWIQIPNLAVSGVFFAVITHYS